MHRASSSNSFFQRCVRLRQEIVRTRKNDYKHTDTHRRARTHACTHANTRAQTNTHVHAHTQTRAVSPYINQFVAKLFKLDLLLHKQFTIANCNTCYISLYYDRLLSIGIHNSYNPFIQHILINYYYRCNVNIYRSAHFLALTPNVHIYVLYAFVYTLSCIRFRIIRFRVYVCTGQIQQMSF